MLEKYAPTRVIETLITKNGEQSLREIARNSGIGASTAKTSLDWLHAKDIVKKKIVGRSHLYSLNLNNPVTRHIKILHSLSEIIDSGLTEEIINRHPHTYSITLYGSVARGEDNPKSDIDILVISKDETKIKPFKAENKLGRETTIVKYTPTQWRRKARDDKPFYDRAIIDGIPLHGELPVVA